MTLETPELELVLVLIGVLNVGFVAGTVWNARAYHRGFVDGLRQRRAR